MSRLAVIAWTVALIALGMAGCGGGARHPEQLVSDPVLTVRTCGPYGPTGRLQRKGCTLSHAHESTIYDPSPYVVRSAPTVAPTGDGRLTGVVEGCGNATQAAPTAPLSCTLFLGRVVIQNAAGRSVAKPPLNRDARFSVTLPAGRYRLIVIVQGQPSAQAVRVFAARTTVADTHHPIL